MGISEHYPFARGVVTATPTRYTLTVSKPIASVLVGVCFSLALTASACGGADREVGSFHSLQTAEKAFFKAGFPFHTEWRRNAYLDPRADPRPSLPWGPPPRKHLIGMAFAMSALTFKNWWVYVFDSTAPAVSFARNTQRQCKPPQCNAMILRANNVVYFGDRLRAASRAMAQLRQQ
jgi:hypothetical protein